MCALKPSIKIQSVAVISLGKLLIHREQDAKRIVPALGKLLDTTPNPSVKSNIMFVLSDMCIR